MALTAPAWSPASVQFTHGFPRRLIQAEHGGFLPGNIIVTAKASNLAIHCMSVLDVASLHGPTVHCWSGSQLRPSAQPPVSLTGISIFCDIKGQANHLVGFLFPSNAAVRYHRSDSYLPDYLVCGTLEFGINFLTFQAVKTDMMDTLTSCLTWPWAADSKRQGEDGKEKRRRIWGQRCCPVG